MRALLLLIAAAVFLWGISELATQRRVEGAEPEPEPEEVGEGRFLAQPPAPPEDAPAEVSGRAATDSGSPAGTAMADSTPARTSEPVRGGDESWLDEALSQTPERRHPQLAGALLHLDPVAFGEALRDAADGLSRDELLLYMAFAEATGGRLDSARERARQLDAEAVSKDELEHLATALADRGSSALPPSDRDPMRLAMAMRLASRAAGEALDEGQWARAADLLSELLSLELDAPWPADRATLAAWSAALREAQTNHRFDPKGDWPSIDMTVEPGDSLTAMRVRAIESRPALVVSTDLIDRVNGIRGRYLQEGQVVRVPTDPVRTLVDLSARWVLVFFGDEVAAAYECGVGAEETPTITGSFVIGTKRRDPPWLRVGHEPVPFGDPENPLGTRWLGWFDDNGRTSYGFHGTWEPETVGTASSLGCIRFVNEEVEELYDLLPRQSPVHVRP